MSRVVCWLAGIVLVPALGFGQVVSGVVTGAPALPQSQSAPPRDPAQQKPGTATLRGHVVSSDGGQPLRKALVRIVAGEIRENRTTTTDADGKYEFRDVVAGRYTVTASKGSYVALQYGQLRPFEPGKSLDIRDGQLVEKVDFALPRGAVITGRIVDEFGEPLSDAMVSVQRYQNVGGQRRLVNAGRNGVSNDVGEFRIFAIPPGQYYLTATLRPMGIGDSDDRSGYVPTYFPGTSNLAEAQRVTVGLGQMISDLNMALLPARTSRVTGTAVDSQGRPLTGMIMSIPRGEAMFMGFGPPTQIKPDGSFAIAGLAPGRYTLQANSGPLDAETAMVDITVNGDDIADLRLVASRRSVVTGRVLVDPAAAQTLRPSSLRLMLQPAQFDVIMMGNMPAPVNDDLTFELKTQPGTFRMAVIGQPGWSIRSVRYRATDVTDSGMEFRANEDVTGVEVELTNKVTDVNGLVTNAKGEPMKDYSVIVFAQDRDKWTPNSRYLKTSRPDQDGRYRVTGLPPGEYRAIALDYVDPNDWNDPQFLDGVRPKATAFSINEGETKSVDLKVVSSS